VYFDTLTALGSNKTASQFWELIPLSGKSNVKTAKYTEDATECANSITVMGSNNKLSNSVDASSISTYNLQMGDVLSAADISDQAMLDGLVQASLAVRKQPRILVDAQPPQGSIGPLYGVDYVVGDTVTVRIVVPELNAVLVNGAVRIWGVDITVDEWGNEQPVFRLQP
jgi:hypothetical protein